MGTETNKEERNTPEYLAQLLKDKKQIQAFPNVFVHLERLLDEEIHRVRVNLFHLNGSNREPVSLPEPVGPVLTLSEKLYVPVKEHPDFNFVGRILGPRGMTAKQLEQDTGCKIMVRGKGSMRDKVKEEMNRGKPNWEHLNEDLHVLITVEETRNRGDLKLRRAVEEIQRLLVPADGEDELKKMQLMELAIMNGTYRDAKQTACIAQYFARMGNAGRFQDLRLGAVLQQEAPRLMAPGQMHMPPGMRSPTPQGAPIILAPRGLQQLQGLQALHGGGPGILNGLGGGPPPLVSPTDAGAGLLYSPYADYGYNFGPSALLEYPTAIDQSAAGAVPKVKRAMGGMGVREHPYTRLSLP